MIYIDTSCLVALVRPEPHTDRVGAALLGEDYVVVSSLAELEATIEAKRGYLAGDYSRAQWRKYEAELQFLRNREPFFFKPVPPGVWEVAFRQHRNSREIHCRTLDRLHIAAADKMGISRIMTHDTAQAKAAREAGLEAIHP